MTPTTWPAPPVYTMRDDDLIGQFFTASGMRWITTGFRSLPNGYDRSVVTYQPAVDTDDVYPVDVHTVARDTAEYLVAAEAGLQRPAVGGAA